jgi:hypothetical protein
MLDPHYRTIEGFQTLIDKEWISFGHKFHDRLGHGNAERTERSPVFLQFIDCVYQIWAQFPAHFEFDQRLLIFILDHIYSGKYGNFLVNCEKDNIHFGMANKTRSIWADVNSNRSYWCNDLYGIYKHQDSCLCNRILVPDLTRIVFWDAYYLRWHSCMQKLVINGHTSRTNGGSIKTSTHTQNPERQFVLNVNTQRRRKSHNMFNILLPTDEDAPNLETKEIDTQLPHDFYSIAVKLQNENKAAHTELERLRKLLAEAGIDSTPPVNAPEATEERKQPRTTRGPPPLPRVEEAKRTVVPKTADLLLEESSSSEEGIVVDL